MPRLARKNLISNFFHVMVQGINREYIFSTNENKNTYKKIFIENLSNYNLTILSYCLMDNHSHFLIFCEDFTILSKFMHKINMKYSNYYNKLNKRVGYVFRDRFKIQQIMDMNQLYNCLKYIHNNPVKANICANMQDYKYSSYNEFLNKKEIINNKSIELLFGCDKNFETIFEMIHNTFNDENFIDIKNMTIVDFIDNFTSKHNVSLYEIRSNNHLLNEFIKNAKKETNVTFKELSELLDVSIGKLKYLNKKQ